MNLDLAGGAEAEAGGRAESRSNREGCNCSHSHSAALPHCLRFPTELQFCSYFVKIEGCTQ